LTTGNVVFLAGTVAADPVTRRMPSGDEVADVPCRCMTEKKRRVGIYVRLSEVRPGEEAASLKTQETDARALIKRKGWSVGEVYRDAGRSAWSDDRDRPAFERMLGDLEAGAITGVVAWKQDRLGRRVAEVADLLDRCRKLDAVKAQVRVA
jgi:resolvase-like protein